MIAERINMFNTNELVKINLENVAIIYDNGKMMVATYYPLTIIRDAGIEINGRQMGVVDAVEYCPLIPGPNPEETHNQACLAELAQRQRQRQ